jgi:EpsI family protein
MMTKRFNLLMFGFWLAVAVGLVFLFGVEGNNEEAANQGRSAIWWMVSRWLWAKTDMSHGWLIPLVSLYMVWKRRQALRDDPRRVNWWGGLVVVLSLLLYLAGLRVQQTVLVLLAGIGLLWGIPFLMYGWAVARMLLFPCGYLVFAIPMTFMDYLTFPLRLVSSTVSVVLLNGFGIPVDQSGTAIMIKVGHGLALDVAHPCSGLRYLLAMIALTTAYAYFTQRSPLKRAILSLSAIPLAMAGNIARITLIALVGLSLGEDFALGFYHDYSGYVVFAVATLLMLGAGRLLDWPWKKSPGRGKDEEGMSAPCETDRLPVGRAFPFAVSLVLALFTMTALLGSRMRELGLASLQTADICQDLPDQVGDWRGERIFFCQHDQCAQSFTTSELVGSTTCPTCGGKLDAVALGERTLLPADTRIVRRIYTNSKGESVTVTVVLSGHERRSIHRPQQCLPAQGFTIEATTVMSVQLEGRSPLKLMLIKAQKRHAPSTFTLRTVMAYWFAGGGHETHDHFRRMAYMAWDNLVHGVRARWAYVSLQTMAGIDDQEAERRLGEMTRALYPLLNSKAKELTP